MPYCWKNVWYRLGKSAYGIHVLKSQSLNLWGKMCSVFYRQMGINKIAVYLQYKFFFVKSKPSECALKLFLFISVLHQMDAECHRGEKWLFCLFGVCRKHDWRKVLHTFYSKVELFSSILISSLFSRVYQKRLPCNWTPFLAHGNCSWVYTQTKFLICGICICFTAIVPWFFFLVWNLSTVGSVVL